MARFHTTIPSTLSQAEAFAYMAGFEHASEWDPTVRESRRLTPGELQVGTAFHVVSHFGGREVALRYEIVRLEPPRVVVLQARNASFTATDAITVEAAGEGSTVEYDAVLEFRGVRRLLEPVLQATFHRLGRAAEVGMRERLNPPA
jgi:hypothetical protein